jgi:regulator of protease activity HflC (stomatin/prohibitin superfamily)
MEPKVMKYLIIGVIGLFVLIFLFPIAFVGAGERGVVFSTFTGVENRILGEGIHWRTPFVESVHKLSIKVQKNDVKAEAASKDLQTISTDIVLNWHLDASAVNKVYQTIGDEQAIADKIITPAVSEVVKASTALYTAEEVIQKRPLLKQTIDETLSQRLLSYNVILDDVSIVNVDFSEEFNRAIEAKSVALQNVQTAENNLKRIEVEASQKVATAKADAEAMSIKTKALEQNAKLVDYEAVLKWNGVLPVTMLGNSTPFVNVNK